MAKRRKNVTVLVTESCVSTLEQLQKEMSSKSRAELIRYLIACGLKEDEKERKHKSTKSTRTQNHKERENLQCLQKEK